MQLYEMDNSNNDLAAKLEKQIANVSSAQFRLGEKLCLVVHEDSLDGIAALQSTSDDNRGRDNWDGHQIVGEVHIEGMRHLILCCIPVDNQTKSVDTRAIADLLTRRELQIALLVAKGRLNKQIADQLKVSEWTVSSHLRRIYAKLGVHTRAAMVACVMRGSCTRA